MRLLGLAIGVLVIIASVISLAAPDLRLSLERAMITPAGLCVIAALRIAIGLVFVLIDWSASAGPLLMRLDAVVGMALGGFLVNVLRTPPAKARADS